jgi:hypothetical protein
MPDDDELTNYMEQSPSWEANRSSTSKEISRILWKASVHYRIHMRSPYLLILSHSHSVHATPFHFLKIHFKVIFSSTPKFSKWTPSIRPPHRNTVCTSPVPLTCRDDEYVLYNVRLCCLKCCYRGLGVICCFCL